MTANEKTSQPHRPVVLITDFGGEGFYVGAMKGAMLAVDSRAVIVDLTHTIPPYAIDQASFVLSTTFEFWPEGTVFLAVVDPGVGGERRHLVAASRDRWIVCPDNGLVSDVAARFGVEAVFEVAQDAAVGIRGHVAAGRTFLGRDVLGPVAAYLAQGGDVERVARKTSGFRRIPVPSVESRDGYVRGCSRHVDAFGNILTNISGEDVARAFHGAPLAKIRCCINNTVGIRGVREYFSEGSEGELMAILDSWKLVEISVNRGRAADRFPSGETLVVELTAD